MIGPYISKIELTNGQSFEFEKNDIIVFVGANNCGKTTTLSEINSLYYNNNTPLSNNIVKSISLDYLGDHNSIKNQILSLSHNTNKHGKEFLSGIGYRIAKNDMQNFGSWIKNNSNHHKIFTSNLETKNRLLLMDPKARRKDEESPPQELYHNYVDDVNKFNKLKSIFEKIFSSKLYFIHPYHHQDLYFKVYDGELKEKLSDDPQYTTYRKKYLESTSLHEQGDGMKSFTGIVGSLIAGDKNIYFIDEPESFLHPPQAKILGQEIAGLTDAQIFLATHSQDFIKGILQNTSNRVKIISIERNKDTFSFNIIEQNNLKNIQKNPFLHFSNYLDSLFNHITVICEDATDCIFYNRIFDLVLSSIGREDISINYVYTGGKNNFKKIMELSKKIGINYIFIGDIDVLNNWRFIKDFINENIKEHKKNWELLNKKVLGIGNTNNIMGKDLKEFINDKLEDNCILEKKDKKNISKFFDKIKKSWDVFKNKGCKIYGGKTPKYYNNLISELRNNKLFLVPIGEMEDLIPSIEGKKQLFINDFLKIDKTSNKLNNSKLFVQEILKEFI